MNHRERLAALVASLTVGCLAVTAAGPAASQTLFVGLEGSEPPTKSSDLGGFPSVSWDTHFAFDVSGAAAAPDGEVYLCNGSFTTRLYRSTLQGPPQFLSTISVDIHALASGEGKLWGFANFADPKGIYEINPATGAATLALDVYTGSGFRFFGLDYNPADGLLYGYTEYGVTGLYSIDLETGEMIRVASPIPAANSQGRGLAVGNNTVYVTATRGDEEIPYFAYDLAQGPNGTWVPFTNPYPEYHSTGGAAWLPGATGVGDFDPSSGSLPRIRLVRPNPVRDGAAVLFSLSEPLEARLSLVGPDGRRLGAIAEMNGVAGEQEFVWDGRVAGRALPAGCYFLRLEAGGRTSTTRVILVR